MIELAFEVRTFKTEARAAGDDNQPRVVGRGIVYDTEQEIWPGYKEMIRKGAAKPAPEVKSYFNHDPSKVLATTASDPPLRLRETDEGVEFDAPIPPTSYGKDLEINLERGNVRGASFAFVVPRGGDKWWEDEDGVVHREITELTYFEVGPVTDPAYITTTAELNSTKQLVEQRRKELRQTPPSEPKTDDDAARLIRHGELKATL